MPDVGLAALVFYALAAATVLSAAGVAFSRNIVYSAFSLMGTLLGAAGIYVLLAADFVAVIQVLIYVGGILVLTLFAVMLTQRIADVHISNRAVGRLPAFVLLVVVGLVMGRAMLGAKWHQLTELPPATPTVAGIGNSLLGDYVLPFEVASVVLLAALVGAVVLSRKELR